MKLLIALLFTLVPYLCLFIATKAYRDGEDQGKQDGCILAMYSDHPDMSWANLVKNCNRLTAPARHDG